MPDSHQTNLPANLVGALAGPATSQTRYKKPAIDVRGVGIDLKFRKLPLKLFLKDEILPR